MPYYKNILVSKQYIGSFNTEVPVYIFNPLAISRTAFLYLVGNDLYADIEAEIDIENYYLNFHRTNKNIDILLLMNIDKKNSGHGRIGDQILNSTLKNSS